MLLLYNTLKTYCRIEIYIMIYYQFKKIQSDLVNGLAIPEVLQCADSFLT